jgi:hypothetical protein
MHTHILYLDQTENCIIHHLSQGFTRKQIKANCGVPENEYDLYTQDIRRKTGIRDQKDPTQCLEYLEKYQRAITGEGPTENQTRAMRLFCLGTTLTAIGHLLRMEESAADHTIRDGCRAAGIFTQDGRARIGQMRIYLATFRPNYKPLSAQETEILRAMAAGTPFLGICGTVLNAPIPYLKSKAKEACMRLGFDVKGRNAQRNLLRAYFAYLDAQDPMNDPLF